MTIKYQTNRFYEQAARLTTLRHLISIFGVFALTTLVACQPASKDSATDGSEKIIVLSKDKPRTAEEPQSKTYNLTLYGYNYTDFSIGSYEVNGQGGGNLFVSSPTAGGGSSVCCFKLYTPVQDDKKLKIRWLGNKRWCELDVPLKSPIPAKPEYLEVHFYRDGHIEVAVTETYSAPRLKLDSYGQGQRYADINKNIDNDDKFAKCERWIEPGSKEYRELADKAAKEAEAIKAKKK
jgi:hypothetical protein